MVEIVTVEPDLIQLRTRRPGWPTSCNVYLIREGEGAAMVDAGLGAGPSLAELLTGASLALARWGQTKRDVHAILLTHTHTDHAGGAIPIARATGARVLVPARGWAQAADPCWQEHYILPRVVRDELVTHRPGDVADHFRRRAMPELFASGAGIDWRLVEDGDEVPIGRYLLKAFHLPGHDVAHLAWVEERCRFAFTGDLLAARGTSLPWYPPNAGGVDGYTSSLRQLSELALELICPGHGAVYRGATDISKLCRNTQRMISEREKQLLAALIAGPKSFAALDNLIYAKSVREAIPWASSVTVAHLSRLYQIGLVSKLENGLYIAEPIAAERHLRKMEI